jgi:hypothetical protein
MEFNSDREAVINGLVLAVTAPTDDQSEQALNLVKKISLNMNDIEMAQCKQQAELILQELKGE